MNGKLEDATRNPERAAALAAQFGMLCDSQIREAMAGRMTCPGERDSTWREGTSGPGVISYGLTSAGYDFRMGSKVKVFTNAHCAVIDPMEPDPRVFTDLYPSQITRTFTKGGVEYTRNQEYVTIPPNGHILTETVEYLDIPDDIMIVVLGKSTYARCATIVNCTPLEPGWRGRVTLEIGNLSPNPARVYLGLGIAQALFFRLSRRPENAYGAKGDPKYQDQNGLVFSRV